jgi:hypothetical protein
MEKLHPDWILESPIDLEYKQYILLAYLQSVKNNYKNVQLYPFLGDLIWHYEHIKELKNNYENMGNLFPKQLSGIHLKSLSFSYEKINEKSDYLNEIQNIIDYSLPLMEKFIKEGKDIYNFVETHIQFTPIGIQPINKEEGYVLFKQKSHKEVRVYEYQTTLFTNSKQQYRGIYFNFIKNYTLKLNNTFEQIKLDLIKTIPKLPNPSTFLFESNFTVPFNHTFLPIAKRSLIKYLAGS